MKTIQEIRRENLLLLLDECGGGRGAAATLSKRSGVPAPQISQLRNQRRNEDGTLRGLGDKAARKLERGMNKQQGWMDRDHGPARNVDEADLLDLFRLLTPIQRDSLQAMAEQFAALNTPDKTLPTDALGVSPRKAH